MATLSVATTTATPLSTARGGSGNTSEEKDDDWYAIGQQRLASLRERHIATSSILKGGPRFISYLPSPFGRVRSRLTLTSSALSLPIMS
jgi:hypothetical protein